MVILVVLLLVVGLIAVHAYRNRSGPRPSPEELHHQLVAAASSISGVAAGVRCQTYDESKLDRDDDKIIGFVRPWYEGVLEHYTVIKYAQCEALADFVAAHGRHADFAEVVAVHALTHESMHMRGIRDEAQAECAAMQRDAGMARILGASDDDARDLAHRYWTDGYPGMPVDYRTPDCAPGAALDEHRPDAPW